MDRIHKPAPVNPRPIAKMLNVLFFPSTISILQLQYPAILHLHNIYLTIPNQLNSCSSRSTREDARTVSKLPLSAYSIFLFSVSLFVTVIVES
jgi:hypothetical protein